MANDLILIAARSHKASDFQLSFSSPTPSHINIVEKSRSRFFSRYSHSASINLMTPTLHFWGNVPDGI